LFAHSAVEAITGTDGRAHLRGFLGAYEGPVRLPDGTEQPIAFESEEGSAVRVEVSASRSRQSAIDGAGRHMATIRANRTAAGIRFNTFASSLFAGSRPREIRS
jgi:hypothetical protein